MKKWINGGGNLRKCSVFTLGKSCKLRNKVKISKNSDIKKNIDHPDYVLELRRLRIKIFKKILLDSPLSTLMFNTLFFHKPHQSFRFYQRTIYNQLLDLIIITWNKKTRKRKSSNEMKQFFSSSKVWIFTELYEMPQH